MALPDSMGQQNDLFFSQKGMTQQLELGEFFRDRYVGKGLITSNYTRLQVGYVVLYIYTVRRQ